MDSLQNPIAIDLVPLEVPQVVPQALDFPTDSQTVTLVITMTDEAVIGAVIPPPSLPLQEQLSVYQTPAVLIVDDDDNDCQPRDSDWTQGPLQICNHDPRARMLGVEPLWTDPACLVEVEVWVVPREAEACPGTPELVW